MENPIGDFLSKQRSVQTYQIEKTVTNVSSAYSVYKSFFGAVLGVAIGLFFFFVGGVKLIGAGIVLVSILIPVGTIWNRRRMMNAFNNSRTGVSTTTAVNNSVALDETIVDYVAGVMATGMRAGTLTIGGAGLLKAPENAIVLTDKNIWFIYIPVPGGDAAIGEGLGVQQLNWMFSYNDLQNKFKKILNTGGLQALVNTHPTNFSIPLNNLAKVETNMMGNLVFIDKQGKKYPYGVRKSEDKEKLKSLFKNYMQAA